MRKNELTRDVLALLEVLDLGSDLDDLSDDVTSRSGRVLDESDQVETSNVVANDEREEEESVLLRRGRREGDDDEREERG